MKKQVEKPKSLKRNYYIDKIKEVSKHIKFSDRTNYIAVCKMSKVSIEQWDKNPSPIFIKGKRPTQTIYLMPDLSHRFKDKDMVQESADELASKLGEGFKGDVCPTKNDMILDIDNFIVL